MHRQGAWSQPGRLRNRRRVLRIVDLRPLRAAAGMRPMPHPTHRPAWCPRIPRPSRQKRMSAWVPQPLPTIVFARGRGIGEPGRSTHRSHSCHQYRKLEEGLPRPRCINDACWIRPMIPATPQHQPAHRRGCNGVSDAIGRERVRRSSPRPRGKNPQPSQVFTAFRECALAYYTADPLLILADAKTVTHTVSTSGMRV